MKLNCKMIADIAAFATVFAVTMFQHSHARAGSFGNWYWWGLSGKGITGGPSPNGI